MSEVTCRDCGHAFGNWRDKCPACGTKAKTCKHGIPPGLCAVCRGTVRATPQKIGTDPTEAREKKAAEKAERKRQRKLAKELKRAGKRPRNGCILCNRRVKEGHKKSTVCPHCSEPIHVPCLELHRNDCQKFQTERGRALKKAGV